jgi:hypothetical protein
MNLDWRQHDIRWIAVAATLVLSIFTLLLQAELTFETKKLLERNAVADNLKLLAYFPDTETQRIVLFQRID